MKKIKIGDIVVGRMDGETFEGRVGDIFEGCACVITTEGAVSTRVEDLKLKGRETRGPFTCLDCGGDCETLLVALKTSLVGGAR